MVADEEKSKSLAALRGLLVKLSSCNDADNRQLVCTPCDGKYNDIAYWVIVANGSPPRGMLIVGQEKYSGTDDVFFVLTIKSRRLGAAQARIVREFERDWLKGQQKPVIVEW